ncbi:MAG: NAD(P)H-dependent oxidoreductase [Candidatus Dormibacteraeota bacterium]|uniref:NAD(P)H-dependent oxidoreductase n=1 Tax=Candidatus Amunia macphersoniae TaxID=3127014 RepID=A0A934KE42_9BACT|nr:NAD(P)H-dependent oxidoreductase [Candidatus Dormibacteraeota bacterium]
MFAEVLDCRILLISGSLRIGSTNSATVRTAASVIVAGVSTEIFEGMGELPHFNPDDDIEALHPAVTHLRTRLAAADAVLFCTPEYAGALPGSFKNLLDWTVGGGTYDKSVAWINASAGSGAVDAHASLRTVLERTGTDIVDAACAHIPVTRQAVGTDGVIEEAVIRGRIEDVLGALAERVRERRAARVAQKVATTVV